MIIDNNYNVNVDKNNYNYIYINDNADFVIAITNNKNNNSNNNIYDNSKVTSNEYSSYRHSSFSVKGNGNAWKEM